MFFCAAGDWVVYAYTEWLELENRDRALAKYLPQVEAQVPKIYVEWNWSKPSLWDWIRGGALVENQTYELQLLPALSGLFSSNCNWTKIKQQESLCGTLHVLSIYQMKTSASINITYGKTPKSFHTYTTFPHNNLTVVYFLDCMVSVYSNIVLKSVLVLNLVLYWVFCVTTSYSDSFLMDFTLGVTLPRLD